MNEKDFSLIIEDFSMESEKLTSQRISGTYLPKEFVKKACSLCLSCISKLKNYALTFSNDKETQNIYLQNLKSLIINNTLSLKKADDFASGKAEVSISQFTTLSVNDIETHSQKYLDYKNELKGMVRSESSQSAYDKALSSLYELKNGIVDLKDLLDKSDKY